MPVSLINHNKGYQFGVADALISLATGLSGAPYAYRHYQLSSGSLGQKALCAIECVPVLGGIAAAIEQAAWGAFADLPYRDNSLTAQQAMEKMRRNGVKAIEEHQKSSWAYASASSAIPEAKVLEREETTPLKFTHHFADAIGPRDQMEDAHFFAEIEQGTLVGVFDGHGGKEVSAYAAQEFEKRFPAVLKAFDGNVFRAFETLIHQIHTEVAENSDWNGQGSTSVISFIDKKTHQIFTATLGDSEANIYRKVGFFGWLKSISLSCVRDWTSNKDAERLEKAHNLAPGTIAKRIAQGANAKQIRSAIDHGVNVSRAIGDIDQTGTLDKPLVIHKPKITVNKLQKGDVLVLACDGLKDYVPERDIVSIVGRNLWTIMNIIRWIFNFIFCYEQKDLAHTLVDYAIDTKKSQDNVTVVTIEVA